MDKSTPANLAGVSRGSGGAFGDLTIQRVYERALITAAALIDNDWNDQAIVTAATACEVYTARAFRLLLEHRGVPAELVEPLAKLIPDATFQEEDTRKTWAALTGKQMNKKEAGAAWADYHNTVVRKRNDIVHRADSATPEEGGRGVTRGARLHRLPILGPARRGHRSQRSRSLRDQPVSAGRLERSR